MKQRIIGIDVARALAVVGMIIVNFKMVLGQEGAQWAKNITGIFEGKAAATFVVLAGVGMALMSNKAVQTSDIQKIRTTRIRIAKRALFLFVIGLSYMPIWPADILHFYGIYMLLTLFVLTSRPRVILGFAALLIFLYPIAMSIWSYDIGWNFDTFEYADFWTSEGFIRNLFYNGFHPVLPWAAFMLVGLWFGRQDLHNDRLIKRVLWISLSIFIGIQVLSYGLIQLLASGDPEAAGELSQILGTSPMPPLPIYMISGSSIALLVISLCILISKKFSTSRIILALNKTGQLALTFYVAHVVIGMGGIDVLGPKELGAYTIQFSLVYAVVFSLLCVLFAIIWRKYKSAGPLEWFIRKVIG